MKGLLSFLLVALVGLASGASSAQTRTEDAAERAAHQASIDLAIAPLRSMKDVRIHLRSTPASPLLALAPTQRREFINSLVFTQDGLGSYSYEALAHGPSVSEVYKVLALFGAQSEIAAIPGLPSPQNDIEVRMMQASLPSPMASAPWGVNGICVINGPNGICVHRHGSLCSRACDRR